MKLNVALGIHPKVEHYNVVKWAIEEEGDSVKVYDKETQLEDFEADDIDFIVSYGYKYLIKGALLERYRDKIVNLHPSYLPWGRGYFPNFWSHVYDFPKGISIHYINAGIDTGAVLAQREHFFTETDTLRTTYYNMQTSMLSLFTKSWRDIRTQSLLPAEQDLADGNLFYQKDFDLVFPLLEKGFDTSLAEIHDLRDRIKEKLAAHGYHRG
jgi:methionyl-tRNA formyltransferase